MYDTILVPVDGSDCSLRAVAEARSLAETGDATVHLLSIVDVRSSGLAPPEVGIASDTVADTLLERAESALREASDSLEGVPVETEVRRAVPVESIVEYATSVSADLVVMGTHGHTGVDRIALGSVAEGVLRRSPVPVLTVREAVDRRSYEDILLPTDGSDHAEAAAGHAIDIARQYDADLHVLDVLDFQEIGGWFDAGGLSDEFVERHESTAREATDRIAERAEAAGVEATAVVERGTAHETILEYADRLGIDLIAMGTHGRSGVSRVLLGSVTESVVRAASCPVLSVRAQE